MNIGRNDFVTFEFVLRNEHGELIEASEVADPPTYIHGYAQLVSGLEKHMEGHYVGDRFTAVVEPEHGYGARDESLVVTVPLKDLPPDVPLNIGQSFDAMNDRGHKIKLRVKEVNDNDVQLDANHPLAGMQLHYDITVKDVRGATEAEIMEVTAPIMGTDQGEV